ncbi:MAG TPA: hypothetical protein VGF61_03780 [Candidatus Acidoferrum sp.]|jgi:hypothetical protein
MRSKRNGHHGGTAVATMDENSGSERADRRHVEDVTADYGAQIAALNKAQPIVTTSWTERSSR